MAVGSRKILVGHDIGSLDNWFLIIQRRIMPFEMLQTDYPVMCHLSQKTNILKNV
jgi:hypothetical protein